MDKYKLTTEQEAIVDKLFALMEEAKNKGVGFIYDKTAFQMSAFNATVVESIDAQEIEDNCNLNDNSMKQCPTEFHADYYSDGYYLVAKDK